MGFAALYPLKPILAQSLGVAATTNLTIGAPGGNRASRLLRLTASRSVG